MINWGILGCGNIARKFAECLAGSVEGSRLAAAAARDADRASAFASTHGIPVSYGTYESLACDPDVDAIYVATPHSHHLDHVLLCLDQGKAVVCEKPLTISKDMASKLVSRAREKNLFLMEAMWMRFLPAVKHIREVLDEGSLGEVRRVTADFSFLCNGDPRGRLLNPALAGGALLDVGVYPLSFALMLLDGEPLEISGSARIGPTGVDEANSFTLEFAGGRIASCTSSITAAGSQSALIECENGTIEAPFFWRGERLSIKGKGREKLEIVLPFDFNGFEYEIREAARCIAERRPESDTMPLDETLRAVAIMDELRRFWQLRYPMES